MNQPSQSQPLEYETAVYERYSAAARDIEPALCCAVTYPTEYLSVIPEEVIAKDYGCGDPTPFVRSGDVVVDLGSGAGKLCFIMAQAVGSGGRVIGVDCNPAMLEVARRHAPTVADRLGYSNVSFRYGLIQDLALDFDQLDQQLISHPVRNVREWIDNRKLVEQCRRERPMIGDESVDCVVSNCVLNLVRPEDRRQLFSEVFRVLRPGGRAAISDIVSNQDVPNRMKNDPALWSGCISGAYREDRFLHAFEEAGFYGIELVKRQSNPWKVVEGVEFRSVTVLAFKGERNTSPKVTHAVVYRGPLKSIQDDGGNIFMRGEPTPASEATVWRLRRPPYQGMFEIVDLCPRIPMESSSISHVEPIAHNNPQGRQVASLGLAVSLGDSCCGEGGCGG
jgi:ubiquinone/menaquinone biosynthesis C-methylase UbiE